MEDNRTFQNSSPNLDRFLTQKCGRAAIFWKRFQTIEENCRLFYADLRFRVDGFSSATSDCTSVPPLDALSKMHTSTVSSQSDDAFLASSDSLSPSRLPLDHPPSDMEEAVEQLRRRPEDELRRARTHHRRALKALQEGAYEALSAETRERLTRQFRSGLHALNRAIDETDAPERDEDTASSPSSTSLRDVFTGLW